MNMIQLSNIWFKLKSFDSKAKERMCWKSGLGRNEWLKENLFSWKSKRKVTKHRNDISACKWHKNVSRLLSLVTWTCCEGQTRLSNGKILQTRLEVWIETKNGYLVDPASSICSSQRLSHARLSTNKLKWNREWLITTYTIYWMLN